MPLQHSDAQMLKAMKRGGSPDGYRRLFDKMRAALPNLTLRTTFLVGFPGETDAHFANLVRFVDDVQFDRVGVFTYSAEEGTPAFSLPDAVPPAVMRERKNALMAAQQPISLARNRAFVGREMDVLVEKTAPVPSRPPAPNNGGAGQVLTPLAGGVKPSLAPPLSGVGGSSITGRTVRDAPEIDGTVTITDCDAKPGEYVRVRVTGADVYDLTARAISQ